MTNYHHTLLTKINTRQATVAAIGLDLDQTKVEALKAGRSYIADVPTVEVLSAVKAGPYGQTTSDYAVLAECDAVSICVPTPLS
jgi:UDP-N-acetyl-D-glucosamine dehydrogenase